MKRSAFKLKSGNTTPFKQMGSSPLHNGDKAFDQAKIKLKTNPNNSKDVRNVGYEADIDDIRKAKVVKAVVDDMSGDAEGTRSGVTSGGAADKLGYSGRAAGAMTGNKGVFEHKYNVAEYGRIDHGTDSEIARNIINTNKGASELARPINLDGPDVIPKGLKLNTNKKKKKSKATTTSTKSKKVNYAKSQLTVKKK
tara:strand:- start:113 stop:700 length:588 start_codon:yes stop_codon:yes gene_type:complete